MEEEKERGMVPAATHGNEDNGLEHVHADEVDGGQAVLRSVMEGS